jgi:hypothetical protein
MPAWLPFLTEEWAQLVLCVGSLPPREMFTYRKYDLVVKKTNFGRF